MTHLVPFLSVTHPGANSLYLDHNAGQEGRDIRSRTRYQQLAQDCLGLQPLAGGRSGIELMKVILDSVCRKPWLAGLWEAEAEEEVGRPKSYWESNT